jgi:hypothetical protein
MRFPTTFPPKHGRKRQLRGNRLFVRTSSRRNKKKEPPAFGSFFAELIISQTSNFVILGSTVGVVLETKCFFLFISRDFVSVSLMMKNHRFSLHSKPS